MKNNSQTVWITGASSGIGEALALSYNAKGYTVIGSARKQSTLNLVKEKCANPDRFFTVPLDLIQHDNIENIVDKVLQKHTIDILINNGGISQRSLAKDTSFNVYKKLMDVNYLGTVALSKAILPHFLHKNKGQYVVISSSAGKFGVPMRSGYSASKFALHGFFEALRAELYDTEIDITMITPGFIKTNISKNALTADGSTQNTMDEAQKNGMPLDEFARIAMKGIEQKSAEFSIGNLKETKFAILVSRLFPNLFRKIIANSKVT